MFNYRKQLLNKNRFRIKLHKVTRLYFFYKITDSIIETSNFLPIFDRNYKGQNYYKQREFKIFLILKTKLIHFCCITILNLPRVHLRFRLIRFYVWFHRLTCNKKKLIRSGPFDFINKFLHIIY